MANMTKEEAANWLASKHFEIEEGMLRIFRLVGSEEVEQRNSEPIKLLEVNSYSVPYGIMPLHFGSMPELGFPYSSIIVEVTPDEFEQIERNELKLPPGWTLGTELSKSICAGAA